MASKKKPDASTPRSKRSRLSSPTPASPPAVHSHRKCRKKLLQEDDDNVPIANLIRRPLASLPPKTPIKHETASSGVAKSTGLLLPEDTPVQASPESRPTKHKHRSKSQRLRPESFQPPSPQVQGPHPVPPELQFTHFAAMSHENSKYSMQATVVQFCSVTLSPSETSLSGFLVLKDLQVLPSFPALQLSLLFFPILSITKLYFL